jgi:hypothetical protein
VADPKGQEPTAEDFGMDRLSTSDNEHGGTHYTVSNPVTRISWDTDDNGDYVEGSHHERRAPGTSGGGIKGKRKP